jgi:hypothetical protein
MKSTGKNGKNKAASSYFSFFNLLYLNFDPVFSGYFCFFPFFFSFLSLVSLFPFAQTSDPIGREMQHQGKEFMEGDAISPDGISREVYEGEVEVTFEKP